MEPSNKTGSGRWFRSEENVPVHLRLIDCDCESVVQTALTKQAKRQQESIAFSFSKEIGKVLKVCTNDGLVGLLDLLKREAHIVAIVGKLKRK